MKIEIDTAAKTVRIIDTLPITDLVAFFKKDWPDQWKDYSIILGSEKVEWYKYPWQVYPSIPYDPLFPYSPIYTPGTISSPSVGLEFTTGDTTVTVEQFLKINN